MLKIVSKNRKKVEGLASHFQFLFVLCLCLLPLPSSKSVFFILPSHILSNKISLSKGGTPARFLIIDDGWQDTTNEFQKEEEPFVEGSQ